MSSYPPPVSVSTTFDWCSQQIPPSVVQICIGSNVLDTSQLIFWKVLSRTLEVTHTFS